MNAQLVQFETKDAQFDSLIQYLSSALFREISHKSTKNVEQLELVSMEVASNLQAKIGENEYNVLLSAYQIESTKKQAERKRERRELLISDQQAAAVQKKRSNLRKTNAKKRKLDEKRPYRVQKRNRREEIRRTGEFE
jgi:hypothetical protein